MNTATDMAARFHSDGSPVDNGQSQLSTLTVSYNSSTQSYTLSKGGRTQTFTAADAVNSGTTDFAAYQKASGNVHEALTLTTPNTSGALTYQYVGGGAWERADIGGTTLDFSYTPFTYGAATADAAVQRTGTGLFSVSLVGARAMDAPYAVAGSGTMQVDFQQGLMSTTGGLTTINVNTGIIESIGIYYGSASLSSTTNNFAGAFAMDDGSRFTGGWQGKFYGPSNQEVGATWYLSNDSGEYAAGYLVGRSDASVTPYNTSLVSLQFSEVFANRASELAFKDIGGGKAAVGSYFYRSNTTLAYDATVASYRYQDTINGLDTTFTAANKSVAQSNTSVDVYQMTDGSGINYKLTLSKPGTSNPQIALTYMSFGHWEQAQSASADARDRWFAWGVRTNGFQIPTGTGHYDGILMGKGARADGSEMYNLTGTSTFDVNFGASTFNGSIHPVGTSLINGATRDFGSFAIGNGTVDLDAGLSGSVLNASSNYIGYFEGALYGPNANEIGGVFALSNGNSASDITLHGAVAGKRTGN